MLPSFWIRLQYFTPLDLIRAGIAWRHFVKFHLQLMKSNYLLYVLIDGGSWLDGSVLFHLYCEVPPSTDEITFFAELPACHLYCQSLSIIKPPIRIVVTFVTAPPTDNIWNCTFILWNNIWNCTFNWWNNILQNAEPLVACQPSLEHVHCQILTICRVPFAILVTML